MPLIPSGGLTLTGQGAGVSGATIVVPSGSLILAGQPLVAPGTVLLDLTATLPRLTAYTEVDAGDVLGMTVSLPSIRASLVGGGYIEAALPSLTSLIDVDVEVGVQMLATLPSLTAALASGDYMAATLPSLSAYMTGSAGRVVNFAVGLPRLSATVNVDVEIFGTITAELPSLVAIIGSAQSVDGDDDAQFSLYATLPSLLADMTSLGYVVADIAGALPSLTTDISATHDPEAEILATLPAIQAHVEEFETFSDTALAYERRC